MPDVPEGALSREALRTIATIEGFTSTVRGLARLSSRLEAHVANLERFGLDASIVRALQVDRAAVELINAVAMETSAQELSGEELAAIDAALRSFEQVVRPLTAV